MGSEGTMSERMIDSMDEDGRALHQVHDAPERSCGEVEAVLFALIDCEECEQLRVSIDSGELEGPDAAERLVLLAHATGCEHCADALAAERHLRVYLRSCFESDAPDGLETRIATALHLSIDSFTR